MKRTRSNFAIPSVLFGLACIALPASGQVMLSPVAASTTIPVFPNNDTVSVTNLINQSGINTPFVSGVTVFDPYFANPMTNFATSGNGGVNNWQSDTFVDNSGYQGYVDFDLGAVYQINKLAIWNRSLSNVTVKVLMNLGGSEQVAGNFTLVDKQSFPGDYAFEVLPFNVNYTGRYVRLEINSVYPFQGFPRFSSASAGEIVASALPVNGAPPPTLSIALAPNGDVRVNFTGTLQASTTVSGAYTNVPGNPTSPHTLPKASLLPQQFFRAKGN